MTIAKKTEDQIWYRGYGDDQYVYYARKGPKEYLGGTFTVETYQDLEKCGFLVALWSKSTLTILIGPLSFQLLAEFRNYPMLLVGALWSH
jgi:hypothetical protein